jgi:hypothetical protein
VRHHASSARSMGWHLTIATKRGVHTASPKLRMLSPILPFPPDIARRCKRMHKT